MTTLTQDYITPGQFEQLNRVGADAWRKVLQEFNLTKDGAQRVHARGDELTAALSRAGMAALKELSVTDQHADEVRPSDYVYPPEYTGPKPILEQVHALKVLFPQLDITATVEFVQTTLPTLQLPTGAEGWFAIPRSKKIAPVYNDALKLMLGALASQRAFTNYREGKIGSPYLRQHVRTATMLHRIGEQQKGDILIVPAQFGMEHRGESVNRARVVIAGNPIEFGACPFMVASMALTHPERYVRWEQLHTDCPGGEYAPGADGVFSRAPCFVFNDGRLVFGALRVDGALGGYGSVSAFLPQ